MGLWWFNSLANPDTVVGGLDIAFDNTSGISSHQRSRWYIPRNDARR